MTQPQTSTIQRLLHTAALLACVLFSAQAQTVQVNIHSLLNARPVTTLTKQHLVPWNKGLDVEWSGEATTAAALAMGTKNPLALPDDGLFPANDKHPDIQLHFSNTDGTGSQVRLSAAADSFVIDVPDAQYDRLDLIVASAMGESAIGIDLVYDTGSEHVRAVIPDFYNPAPTSDARLYDLAVDLGKWSKANAEMEHDHHYIHGLRLSPSPLKKLRSIVITKSAAGCFTLWGATGVVNSSPAAQRTKIVALDYEAGIDTSDQWVDNPNVRVLRCGTACAQPYGSSWCLRIACDTLPAGKHYAWLTDVKIDTFKAAGMAKEWLKYRDRTWLSFKAQTADADSVFFQVVVFTKGEADKWGARTMIGVKSNTWTQVKVKLSALEYDNWGKGSIPAPDFSTTVPERIEFGIRSGFGNPNGRLDVRIDNVTITNFEP